MGQAAFSIASVTTRCVPRRPKHRLKHLIWHAATSGGARSRPTALYCFPGRQAAPAAAPPADDACARTPPDALRSLFAVPLLQPATQNVTFDVELLMPSGSFASFYITAQASRVYRFWNAPPTNVNVPDYQAVFAPALVPGFNAVTSPDGALVVQTGFSCAQQRRADIAAAGAPPHAYQKPSVARLGRSAAKDE